MPTQLFGELQRHLFPGDGDEHGAVIAASVLSTDRGTRLLGHRLFIAQDGIDYVRGQRGYRMLTSSFVTDCVLACAELRMAYLAVHCHGGADTVWFSDDDMASHERGYPALLDILDGPPVGALVFAREAVAGDIWLPDRTRLPLDQLVATGRPIQRLFPAPLARPRKAEPRYDRQARLFGDRGQELLRQLKVGVIGAGGAGSIVNEHLAHLGVGQVVIIDPERIEPSNLPRVVGSRRRDVRPWLTHARLPVWVRSRAERLRTAKVAISRRAARVANPNGLLVARMRDITSSSAASDLLDADYLFLAADSMQARLVFNALIHQYLIPGVQMGAKVVVDQSTGDITDLFTVTRPVVPGVGCLWCNELISPARLQDEATDPDQRRRQRYVDDEEVPDPSVITLNSVAASTATDDFMMSVTGLLDEVPLEWVRTYPRKASSTTEIPRRDARCSECSAEGRLGRGPTRRLPLRQDPVVV
jgi:molybdopterin/thiamine biosynthesis adenylyltransferase